MSFKNVFCRLLARWICFYCICRNWLTNRYSFHRKCIKSSTKNSVQPKRFVVPTNGLIALDIDGKLNVMTSNGRFVLKGYLYDTWAKKPLEKFDDVAKYASIIPMKELNLNIADLQPAVWGSGPEKVMIFIDPNCQYCHATLKELADLDPKNIP